MCCRNMQTPPAPSPRCRMQLHSLRSGIWRIGGRPDAYGPDDPGHTALVGRACGDDAGPGATHARAHDLHIRAHISVRAGQGHSHGTCRVVRRRSVHFGATTRTEQEESVCALSFCVTRDRACPSASHTILGSGAMWDREEQGEPPSPSQAALTRSGRSTRFSPVPSCAPSRWIACSSRAIHQTAGMGRRGRGRRRCRNLPSCPWTLRFSHASRSAAYLAMRRWER